MRKSVMSYLLAMVFACFIFSGSVWAEGGSSEAPAKKISDFDYSQYLAPKAVEAIESSQGTVVVTYSDFRQPYIFQAQGLIVDAEEGVIVSVAHVAPEFPGLAFSDLTFYDFVYKGEKYQLRLHHVNAERDLAVYKLKDTEKKSLIEAGAKNVVFTKEIDPFEEVYSLMSLFQSVQGGLFPSLTLPFKARFVGVKKMVKIHRVMMFSMTEVRKVLYFDRAIKQGFSGAGFFNKNGEVVGLWVAIDFGYSVAISVDDIESAIKRFYELEDQKSEKKAEEEATK